MTIQTKIKIKYNILTTIFNVLIFSFIGVYAYFFNKIFETIALFITYAFLRYSFPKTFHLNNMYWCFFWSIMSFWLTIPLILPKSTSILFSVLIGTSLCFILYKIKDYFDLKNFKQKCNDKKLFNKDTTLDNLSLEQLLLICNKLHYKKDKTNLAQLFFIEKLKNVDVWDILLKNGKEIDLNTVTMYKYRISKDIKNFLKNFI